MNALTSDQLRFRVAYLLLKARTGKPPTDAQVLAAMNDPDHQAQVRSLARSSNPTANERERR